MVNYMSVKHPPVRTEDRERELVERLVGKVVKRSGSFAPRTRPFESGRERRIMLKRFRQKQQFGHLWDDSIDPPFVVYCHPLDCDAMTNALNSLGINNVS